MREGDSLFRFGGTEGGFCFVRGRGGEGRRIV